VLAKFLTQKSLNDSFSKFCSCKSVDLVPNQHILHSKWVLGHLCKQEKSVFDRVQICRVCLSATVEPFRSKSARTSFPDDTEDVHTSDSTGILGSLPLGVVEVRGDSNDSVIDGVTQVRLCSLLRPIRLTLVKV
jgi:hypothetical protein